jgi:prophage antirepressor-like protein
LSSETKNVPLEITVIDGKEYFEATPCAKALEYSNPHKAIADHCRYLMKREVPHPQSPGKIIEKTFISEGDLYRLIVRSKLVWCLPDFMIQWR